MVAEQINLEKVGISNSLIILKLKRIFGYLLFLFHAYNQLCLVLYLCGVS